MKKILLVLLCGMQGIGAGVRVSENSVTRFSFTWDMEGFSLADSGGRYSRISFKNQNVELGDSGEAVIPAFSFYVGIPPKGNFQVGFTPLSTRVVSLKNSLNTYKANKRQSRYPDLAFSDPWLSKGRPTALGAIQCRQFILKPFIYNEKAHTLQVLERARYTVTFTGSQTSAGIAAVSSDYQRMLSRLILNYAIAEKWAIAARGLPKRTSGATFPLAPGRPMIAITIGDGHDSTNEGTINENGLVKIPGDSLKKLGSGLLMSQIACFASFKGEMPTQTPDISALPDGITEIPLLRFDLNNNGVVDSEDYVVAYVTGASDWAFDTSSRQYFYRLNRYEDYRHYWITLKQGAGGARLQAMTPILGPVGATMTSFRNHLLLKESVDVSNSGGDVLKGERSGLDWRWAMLTQQKPFFSFQAQLPNIDTAFTAEMRVVRGDTSGQPDMNATFSNVVLCTTCHKSTWYRFAYRGNRTLNISAVNMAQDDYTEITALEFRYTTDLDMSVTKSLTVFSPETSSVVRYQISNLPAEPVYIFRIAADESMRLVDTLHPQKGSSCAWIDSAGKGVRYFISAQSGFLKPPACLGCTVALSDNVNIRDLRAAENPSINQADYLVISHPDFLDQAQRLAQHKLKAGRFKNPKVVNVVDIYREFSGGNLDPSAIRNFLVYAHTLWGVRPEHVVLMGKGHYNYKGFNVESEPIFIPVFESRDRCIEDFYAYLAPGADADSSTIPVPDIYIGRLPCITDDQARAMVDKIVGMEDPSLADYGAWRNRVLLVNDDDMQNDGKELVPDGLRTQHLDASEAVGQEIGEQRPAVDIRKVNLFEYPWNQVFQKPEARDALLNDINGGVAFVNYFGHGGNGQWADELILDANLIANFHNIGQYPLISSFSCSVGWFDQPEQRSLAENLVLAGQSGAIAAISSTRVASADGNRSLALDFYGGIFDSTRSGVSCGEAYAEAKIIVHDENSQIYSYLGDPSICPVTLLHYVTLDVHNSSGASIDTLKALQSIIIRGTVSTNGATTVNAHYGTSDKPASVQISMFNPDQKNVTRKDGGTLDHPLYELPGTPLFTGQVDVKNGVFEQTVHVPRNVTFNKTGAEIIAFSWQAFDNGLGYKSLIFHGTDTSGIIDTTGPTIAIRALSDDPNAQIANNNVMALSAGKVQAILPFKCEIVVFASNGIDVTGTGPDEGLTMEIPGNLAKQNINSKFSYSGGDYRKGSATVEFGEGQLRPGAYTLSVSAQDLAGNITKRDFTLEISNSQDLAITRVFNFPNPMKMGKTTAFYFDLSKMSNVRSTIKLYAMSGKLLRVFYGARSGEVFDGRDQTGNLLGPKVYLYQLIAEDMDQQKTVKSAIQKLAVHPPR